MNQEQLLKLQEEIERVGGDLKGGLGRLKLFTEKIEELKRTSRPSSETNWIFLAFEILSAEMQFAQNQMGIVANILEILAIYTADTEDEEKARKEIARIGNLIGGRGKAIDWLEKFQNHKAKTEDLTGGSGS